MDRIGRFGVSSSTVARSLVSGIINHDLPAAGNSHLSHLLNNSFGDPRPLAGQKNPACARTGRVLFNGDQAEVRATVPGPVANVAEIAGHHTAIFYADRTSIRADALALIEGDHQENGYIRKGNRAAQIQQRLERRQEGWMPSCRFV